MSKCSCDCYVDFEVSKSHFAVSATVPIPVFLHESLIFVAGLNLILEAWICDALRHTWSNSIEPYNPQKKTFDSPCSLVVMVVKLWLMIITDDD